MIKIDYKNDKPLHEQITLGIKELVMCGALLPNEQLPSVRDLSVSLTVNPNTVQRAYKTLEAEGIIYSIRGKGNFVSEAPEADKRTIDSIYAAFVDAARELAFFGETKDAAIKVLDKVFEEREELK